MSQKREILTEMPAEKSAEEKFINCESRESRVRLHGRGVAILFRQEFY